MPDVNGDGVEDGIEISDNSLFMQLFIAFATWMGGAVHIRSLIDNALENYPDQYTDYWRIMTTPLEQLSPDQQYYRKMVFDGMHGFDNMGVDIFVPFKPDPLPEDSPPV